MWIKTDKDRFVRTYNNEYNFIAGEVIKIEDEKDIKFFKDYAERINFKTYIFDSEPEQEETNESVSKKLFGSEKSLSKAEKKRIEAQGIVFNNPMIDSKPKQEEAKDDSSEANK